MPIPIVSKGRVVNKPINQTYSHLLEFINSPELKNVYGGGWFGYDIIKVVDSKEPIYAKVNMEMKTKLSPMAVNIKLASKDGESHIRFDFNFLNLILYSLLISVVYVGYSFYSWSNASNYRYANMASYWGYVLPYALSPIISLVTMFFLYRYSSTNLVKRFMDEFELFFFRLDTNAEGEKD